MIFLLDTNIVSEMRKRRPHGGVRRWYASHPETSYALPSIAIYEIQAGAEITRGQDATKAAELDEWVEALLRETTVLPLDPLAARETARLVHGKSQAILEDAMIAAIARVHGLTVATRNVRDFRSLDVPVVNPFTYTG